MNQRIMLDGIRAEAERAIAKTTLGSVPGMLLDAATVLMLVSLAEEATEDNEGFGGK